LNILCIFVCLIAVIIAAVYVLPIHHCTICTTYTYIYNHYTVPYRQRF